MHRAIVTTKCPIFSSSLKKYSTVLNVWLMGWSKGSLTGEPKHPPSPHKRLTGTSHKSSNVFPGSGQLIVSNRETAAYVYSWLCMELFPTMPDRIIDSSSFIVLFHSIFDFTPTLPTSETVWNPWHIVCCLKNAGDLKWATANILTHLTWRARKGHLQIEDKTISRWHTGQHTLLIKKGMRRWGSII